MTGPSRVAECFNVSIRESADAVDAAKEHAGFVERLDLINVRSLRDRILINAQAVKILDKKGRALNMTTRRADRILKRSFRPDKMLNDLAHSRADTI